jgi:hypothetical protein
VIGQALQINALRQRLNQYRFCGPGTAAEQPPFFARVIEHLQAGAAQRFKSSGHFLSYQACFAKPLLGKPRTLAATPAHD